MTLLQLVQRLRGDGSKRERRYDRGDVPVSRSADERGKGC